MNNIHLVVVHIVDKNMQILSEFKTTFKPFGVGEIITLKNGLSYQVDKIYTALGNNTIEYTYHVTEIKL